MPNRSASPVKGGAQNETAAFDDTVFDDTVFVDAHHAATGVAPFDVAAAQRRFWPWVTPAQLATVVDRAGLHSINPAMALAIESESGRFTVSRLGTSVDLDRPLAEAASAFYSGRARSGDRDAGLRAVAEMLEHDSTPEEAMLRLRAAFAKIVSASHAVDVAGPPSDARGGASTDSVAGSIPPIGFLSLPFPVGAAWAPGGVHTTTGANDGSPMSSIDWSHGWPTWGTNTASEYVSAMHGGTVTVYSGCNVRVTNANGWATNYYHLSSVVVSTGQVVSTGAVLSTYADNVAQATCQGGTSSGPHVHVSLLRNGFQYAIDGATINGWLVHSGRISYDYDPNFMWYFRGGSTSSAFVPIPRDDCRVASSDIDVPAGAGEVGLGVNVASGCPWEVTSESPWITVAEQGTGPGATVLTLLANPSSERRSGTVLVAGNVVNVTQASASAGVRRDAAAPVEPIEIPGARPTPTGIDPLPGPRTRVAVPVA